MSVKDKLAEIKKIVFGEEVQEEVQEFADYKTTDGIILRCDELVEGATVSIISEDGEAVSGAASYVLEDGRTIEVSEEGAVVSIMEAEEESEEVMEEVMEEVENPLEGRIERIESGLKEILGLFESQEEKFSKEVDLSKELAELKADFEAFKSAPAEDEIKVLKTLPKNETKEDKARAIARFRNNAK